MTKKETNYVSVEVDLDDDVFMALAKIAHERDITFNELCREVLQAYVDGKIDLEEEAIRERNRNRLAERAEQQEQNELEDDLRDTVRRIIIGGVTTSTLNDFGHAFSKWDYGFHGQKTSTEIIQDGFDDASLEDPPF
jgi:hypothetical protein